MYMHITVHIHVHVYMYVYHMGTDIDNGFIDFPGIVGSPCARPISDSNLQWLSTHDQNYTNRKHTWTYNVLYIVHTVFKSMSMCTRTDILCTLFFC